MPGDTTPMWLYQFLVVSLLGSVAPLVAQEAGQAELVGKGTVSSDRSDTFPAVSADGQVLYFSRVKEGRGWSDQELMQSEWRDSGWSEPEVLPFSGTAASDRAPRPTPEGNWVIFTSNRPLPGAEQADAGARGDYNLWVARRDDEGQWYGPVPLAGDVNTEATEGHSSLTEDGVVYFYSRRDGGYGKGDIYRARRDGDQFIGVENLGPPINSAESQSDLWVSPFAEWMILVITDHPDGFGGDDLYMSEFRDGAWSKPRNLGPEVNTAEYEYGPYMDPTGTWLYFTSHRSGDGDIYRIRLREVLRGQKD
jgi:hypothetical protein